MRKLHTRNGGFTLIELMIVVAIIGILAAIAIPNFLRFQLRSRVGEGKTNIAAIRTAEESYAAEYATYIGAAAAPGGTLSGDKQNWLTATPGFDTMGWFPEGEVYYNYNVTAQSRVAARLPATPARSTPSKVSRTSTVTALTTPGATCTQRLAPRPALPAPVVLRRQPASTTV